MTFSARIAAMLLLAMIAFTTLSPIGMRPHVADANLERGFAFALLGIAVAFGFPQRVWQSLLFVATTAMVLELMQTLEPSRHGRMADAVVKASAGIAGVLIGQIVARVIEQRLARQRTGG